MRIRQLLSVRIVALALVALMAPACATVPIIPIEIDVACKWQSITSAEMPHQGNLEITCRQREGGSDQKSGSAQTRNEVSDAPGSRAVTVQ